MKNKVALLVAVRTAIIVFISGWVYSEFQSIGLTALTAVFMTLIELNFIAIGRIQDRLPSEQDMADIKQASKDMAELKKHMDWQ